MDKKHFLQRLPKTFPAPPLQGRAAARVLKKTRALEKAREVHGDAYDYSRVVFVNATDKVEIICPTHGSFWQGLYDHTVRKTKCPQCARDSDRLTLDDFIKKSREVHGDAYDYDKVEYQTNASMVTITCKKHGDFIQRAASHLAGCQCKKCYFDGCKLPLEEFIKNAKQVHGDSYDYSKVVYRGNKTPVEIVCSAHGAFWQKPNSHISSRMGCRLCSESKGEKAVEIVLKKYGIKYIREYRIEPHRYRFDFYLPGLNIYIEFHGHQHYRPVAVFGGDEAFLKTQERDEVKKQLVASRGESLVVLNHLNLNDGSLERELIGRLKRIYRYWFVINGSVVAFRTWREVYLAFHIPSTALLRETESLVVKSNPGVRVLF